MATAARALRVLIADDDIDTVDSTARLLKLGGFEVVTASTGLSALTLAAVFRPELVLLDIAMPGQDGYATAQRIQHLSMPRRPYIVAVTAWATQDHKRRSAQAGFDLHLTKPVDGETYQTLAALVQTFTRVEERFRVFSAQQRPIATELIFQQGDGQYLPRNSGRYSRRLGEGQLDRPRRSLARANLYMAGQRSVL